MKKKSDTNLKLAQDLINLGEYNASVHCSYYGCFQYLKCILKNNLNLSYSTQNEDRPESHNFLLENLFKKINNPKTIKNIREDFIFLKEKRKIADYCEEEVGPDGSLDALEEAKAVIYKVKNALGGLNL
ncbi:MAG: HEPN domain-containing protein [Dysgonomonas sp.]